MTRNIELPIDKGVSYVTSIFDASVYIASRKDKEFDLKQTNDRCKVQGANCSNFDGCFPSTNRSKLLKFYTGPTTKDRKQEKHVCTGQETKSD
ncbi:hypothetical protein PoB_005176200 [Plakobranchus ocellatus]|uniref:Uncharacterized protein n=1 Tax=Plakobranchus ocellatus TaxID=259542 RepID=A0AAV4C0Y9_9GAST|nr:hypothetical protein PoB_005176200 [Plakobranchus ocellatus]